VSSREALVIGLVAAFLIGAPSAHAVNWCARPVAVAHPKGHAARGVPAPLAIGDSTMVFAVKYLAREGFDANARVCRSWSEGLGILRQRKRAHRLPSLVVMALGANSTLRPLDIRRGLRLLGPQRRLGLVTHRTWFGRPGADTRVIRRMAHRYRKRIRLIDWVHYAAPHPDWFIIDGLHTTDFGSRMFARFIARSAFSRRG
jgi:hypothetical protein